MLSIGSSARAAALAVGIAALAMGAAPAKADAVADFYKNHDLTLLVGYPPAGSYNAYARLAAQHMAKYIPGKPNIIVQNMAGGGSLRATSWLYNVGAKDGSVLGLVADTIAVSQLLFPKKAKYDMGKMHYVGGFTPVNPVLVIRSDRGAKTFEDTLKHQVVVGCTGAGSQSYIMPRAMKEILGAKFKMVCGYAGSAAMTRYDASPRSMRPMNGNVMPAKLDPPPAQPMITSGSSPAMAICSIASCPITVWCRSTKSNTDPSEYFVCGWVIASSTASLIAIPSEPGESGVVASRLRPYSVSWLGLGTTEAPYVSIRIRRYGFWS